jgi:hypothetical protein
MTILPPKGFHPPAAGDWDYFNGTFAGLSLGPSLGMILDAGGQVLNVKNPAYGAVGDGVTDDTAAFSNVLAVAGAISAPVYIPAGTFLINQPLNLQSGVSLRGAGRGQTTLLAGPDLIASGGAVLQKVCESASDTMIDISVTDLTIDAVAGPSGEVDAIWMDSSVSEAIAYHGTGCARVTVRNARTGIRWDANNVDGGPMNNELWAVGCHADNCAVGFAATGTYAASYSRCFATRSTMAGWGTGGVTPGFTWSTGQGPTTLTRVYDCHIEGLGNISGAGTETDHGLYIAGSDFQVRGLVVSNVSRYGAAVVSGEGYAALLSGVTVWGAGFSGVYLSGGSSAQQGICSDISLYNVSQSSQAGTGQQCALYHGSGNWLVEDVWIPTASDAPPYGIGVGGDAPNSYDLLRFTRVNCPAPKSGRTYLLNSSTGIARFSDCQGINPAGNTSPLGGSVTPPVPASTDVVTNTVGVDVMVYVTGGAGGQVYIDGVYTGVSEGAFFLGAGSTIQLYNYTTEPTWVWVGR